WVKALRNLVDVSGRSHRHCQAARIRLLLEHLEDRLAPASVIIFYSGDKIEAKSSAGANIRTTPGGQLVHNEPEFQTGTVLSTTPQFNSSGGAGYWYQIKWDDDTAGNYVGDWTGDSVLGLAFGKDGSAISVGQFNAVSAYSN